MNILEKSDINKTQQTHYDTKTNHIKKNKSIHRNHLKQNRQLLSYLMEEELLTEKEIKTLSWYRYFHFKSKKDIGAPKSFSQLSNLSQKFGKTHYYSEEEKEDEAQKLINFRKLRRKLFQEHIDLVTFAEAFFDYQKNDLDLYQTLPKEMQNKKVIALKNLAQHISKGFD